MINWLIFNIQIVNFFYALSGLIMLGLFAILVFDYYFNTQKIYRSFVSAHIWVILMLVTIGATATTLLYSEVFGFVPCSLCWLQRVALYPQVLLVLAAWRVKDVVYFPLYGIVLSSFGFVVAVYHYIDQVVAQQLQGTDGASILPCLADGTADCSKRIIDVFGWITFPFLSAGLFAFLIILYIHLRTKRESDDVEIK